MPDIYRVQRYAPELEAMQWDGKNTTQIVVWAQGGWKTDGIWCKQTFPEGSTEPVWFLVLPDESELAVGDWVVQHPDGKLVACSNAEIWNAYRPLDTRNVA